MAFRLRNQGLGSIRASGAFRLDTLTSFWVNAYVRGFRFFLFTQCVVSGCLKPLKPESAKGLHNFKGQRAMSTLLAAYRTCNTTSMLRTKSS